MDGTFLVSVFKTHTIVCYNLELKGEKMKSNSNGKVKDGARLKAGDPGAVRAGKRMPELSTGVTTKMRRPSNQKNKSLKEWRHRNQR